MFNPKFLQETVDGTFDYVYSGLQVIDEVCGGVHERHVYAGGMHIASNTTGTVEYYHVDHLGSTRLKTNSSGGVVYESNYEPFGVSSGEVGDEDYRYTGKQEDTTGLYYYGARYYDPDTGRFISRDTVFGDLTDPQSQNRYVYCRNNPNKYVDPDGKEPLSVAIATAAMTGAILGSCGSLAAYLIFTPRDQWNAGTAAGVFVTGGVSGAALMVTGVFTTSVAIIAGVATVAAAASYPVIKMYEYEAGNNLEYDLVEHVSTIVAAPITSTIIASTGSTNEVIEEIASQSVEFVVEKGLSTTLKNAQNYDPWVEDYYWNQPKTVIFDWDEVEKKRF